MYILVLSMGVERPGGARGFKIYFQNGAVAVRDRYACRVCVTTRRQVCQVWSVFTNTSLQVWSLN